MPTVRVLSSQEMIQLFSSKAKAKNSRTSQSMDPEFIDHIKFELDQPLWPSNTVKVTENGNVKLNK